MIFFLYHYPCDNITNHVFIKFYVEPIYFDWVDIHSLGMKGSAMEK